MTLVSYLIAQLTFPLLQSSLPIPASSYQAEDVEIPDSFLYSCEPKRQRIEKTLHADDLIHAEPCYRTVTNLNLWDVSSIDLVLISSPMGMLGLPFLTRNENFSAKVNTVGET